MKRRQFILAAASLTAATTLPGCSSGSSSSGGGGDVTLQMVESLTNPTRSEVLKKLLAEFESANPGIKVQLVSPPTEQADQKIQQMLQAGSGADVLEVRDLTVGPFSNNGWLYDMTADVEKWDGFANLTPQAQKYSKHTDGKTYFIPYGFYGLSLFYRTDLIKEAGFSAPPTNWDELLTQASKIQDPSKNRYGYAFRGGKNGNGNVVACIEAYVGDTIDRENAFKTKDGKSIFVAPEAQQAVDTYFQLFTKASPPSSVAWGYPEMVEGFNNGSTAFLLQDPEVIATINASKSITKDQWNTAPLLTGPSGKASQPVATAGWGVAKSSKNTEAAVKLVEFLSGDASTTFAKENSLVPILKTAGADEFYKTGPWASYVTMTEQPDTYLTVVQPRGVAWWTEWSTKADNDVQQVLINKMSTAELLKSWDEFWVKKWNG
ncbi:MAG: extracellular solute-binding protein family 1 [Propionibacteriaceae bacterium]|jgi:multiple sugar transport system substrate-binding protein|nr:extracellular solute-binding protein family 1 [Propionibacteriaceae bacterium]